MLDYSKGGLSPQLCGKGIRQDDLIAIPNAHKTTSKQKEMNFPVAKLQFLVLFLYYFIYHFITCVL
jgi:hypothetical protein